MQSDQHECAMNLLKRERAIGSNALTSSYALIVKVLSTISEEEWRARHGVAIGNSYMYTNEIAGKTFSHYMCM